MKLAADLKAAVLQAAFKGELTHREEGDTPIIETLRVIRSEKDKLIAKGKVKKEKPLPEIENSELPFSIPTSWVWKRWGDIAFSIQYGFNAPALTSGKIRMVRISDIKDNVVNWATVPYCNIPDKEIETYLLASNDILFARTGGTVGKSYIVTDVPEPAIFAGYLIRTQYSNELVPQYLKYFMESELYWNQLRSGTKVSAQPNCNGKTLSKMVIPLPPIEEQQRIVERINELMPVIEEYEQMENRLVTLKDEFPVKMRSSILRSALQGELTERLDSDDSASDLVQILSEEKGEYRKKRKARSGVNISDIQDEEIPFEIPSSWRFIRIIDAVKNIVAGGDKPIIFSKVKTDKCPIEVISNGEINNGVFGYTDKAVITEKCLTVSGRGTIGYSAIRTEPFVPIVRLLVLLPLPHTNLEYLKYVLESLLENGSGTAVKQLTVPMLSPKVIPLPPLAEQQRIVDRLKIILPLCDKLVEES